MGKENTPDDKRALSHEALEDIRISTVRRIVEAGESPEDLARILGFSRSAIYKWLKAYDEGGYESLRAKPVPGPRAKLNDEQLDWIRAIILVTQPLDWRFDTPLWTRRMAGEVIERVYGVTYSVESVGRLMREKMKLSVQRPARRATEQDPEAIRHWLVEEYPRIAKRARDIGATLYFGDESGVRSEHHAGTTWSARGETPVIEKTGKRFALNLISAISPDGSMRYMQVDGRMNAARFIDFLKRLIKGRKTPVFLIVDGHPSHKAKVVREYVRSTDGQLELFFLPAYSPQLNPDELVWNRLKNHYTGRRAIHTFTELKRVVHSALRSMQGSPELIRSFFGEAHVVYARI